MKIFSPDFAKICGLLPAVLLFFAAAAGGATLTVNLPGDDGDLTCDATCTLRDAIDDANASTADDAIVFAPEIAVVTLAGEIVINNRGKLTITGRGANLSTIDGGPGQNRIFFANAANLTLRHLTLTGGNGAGATFTGNGGAIYAFGGAMTLDHVHVTGNTAVTGGPAGGIYFAGGFAATSNRIIDSTFSNNASGTSCGGFYSGGDTLVVVNSTFYGNSAQTGGAFCSDSSTTLRNVTIYGNSTTLGGGAFYHGAGTLNFGNSIVAGNTANSGPPEIFNPNAGNVVSNGSNLVGDSPGDAAATTSPIAYQTSDILDTPPLVGALQNNGGPTPTLALLAGSPAIDRGNPALAVDPSNADTPVSRDQRDFRRTAFGGLAEIVDIGAVEYNSTPAAGVALAGKVTARNRGAARVRITITDSNGESRTTTTNPAGFYRFKDVRTATTYTIAAASKQYAFSPQQLTVNEDLNVNFTAP
ncbi:MAG: carboxypeptidase regulatory-like domain-containing protein [Acidobacteria bacterium]|nr:carboxypeptidase regulatory-like domain-containing protein [Acidobacteriota bacterium]